MIRRLLHRLGFHEWRYHGRMWDRRVCIHCGKWDLQWVNEWGVVRWL